MNVKINPMELSEALSVVSKALPARTDIPVLEGIKISAEGDMITLTASDLEIFIERKLKANVIIEGECVVIGRIFCDFIRKLVDLDEIELELRSDKMEIRYGFNKGEIQCLNLDTFPEMMDILDDASFSVKERALKELLETTTYCVSLEESRPILKGVLLETKGDELIAVAMDGYRLAKGKVPLTEKKGDKAIVVLGKIMNDLSKILEDSDDIVKTNVQKNNVQFDLGHTKIIARLMEGDYINYERMLAQTVKIKVIIKKDEFETGLDRAGLIARINKKSSYVKLSITESKITIRSNADIGAIQEDVPCKTDGNDLDIAFNSKFLFDAFNHIRDEMIMIEFNNHNTPALIKPVEGERFVFIVLPVRMVG